MKPLKKNIKQDLLLYDLNNKKVWNILTHTHMCRE
jgi:hypothetical protein